KDLGDATDFLNSAVDPRCADFPTRAVDPQPSFAVVEATDDDIHIAKESQAKVAHYIAMDWRDMDIGVDVADFLGRRNRLALAEIFVAKQDRPSQIAVFDLIEIDHPDVADPQQREVFEHLVANRPRSHDEHLRRAQLVLIPPAD